MIYGCLLYLDTMSHTNIYVVACQGGRFYIGKSDNVQKRFEQHLSGEGSAWTRKYKAISLAKVIKNVSHFEEDKVVKEYMDKYGVDKVRGGSYSEIELSEFQIEALKMENRGAKDLCNRCGRGGHFVKDCFATKDASGNKIVNSEDEEEDEEDYEDYEEDDEEDDEEDEEDDEDYD